MKTNLEEISPIRKKLTIEVEADIVAEARKEALSELQKQVKIEGFRPGKVPPNIIQQKLGKELEQHTVEKLVDLTLSKAFQEAKVQPISKPEIAPGLWNATGGFSYTAQFEILPEIILKESKGLKLEKEEVQVSKEELEEEISRLQQAMTQLEPLPSGTLFAEGHVATIDFKGLIDGKSFKGSEAKDYSVELGTGSMLADFEKALKGVKSGEDRDIQFDYPKDYFNKELAGKPASFKVSVKEIRKKNVPHLDDEFAKDLGNFKTMKEVRADMEKRIAEAKESRQKGALYDQIIKQLVEKNKFDIPESLVRSELSHMLQTFAEEIKKRGQKLEDVKVEEVVKEFQPEAEFRVRGFLVLKKVAEEAKVEVTQEELDKELNAIAKGLNRPVAEVRAHYEKNNLLRSLYTRILHEKALEFVLNQAKIKTVKPKNDQKLSKK